MKELQELQSKVDRDLETLTGLGANLVINGVEFPPPTTAVLSLLEIVESPLVKGFDDISDIQLKHINEALYIVKHREKAVDSLFGMVRFEKIANKSPEFFEKYLNSTVYSDFEKRVFVFAESLGLFDELEVLSQLQEYMNICFNAFEMMPKTENKKESSKKKDTTI